MEGARKHDESDEDDCLRKRAAQLLTTEDFTLCAEEDREDSKIEHIALFIVNLCAGAVNHSLYNYN